MLNQLISNRHHDKRNVWVFFRYFSVTYTLMFLLTPDKTEDRTDREVKSFRLTNGIGSAVHLAVAGGVYDGVF